MQPSVWFYHRPCIWTCTHIVVNPPSPQTEMVGESRSDCLPFPVLQVNPIPRKKQAKHSLPLLIQLPVLSKSHKRGRVPTWETPPGHCLVPRKSICYLLSFKGGRKQYISTEVKYHCELWVSITKRPLGRWRSSWHRHQCRQIRV